MNRSSFSMILVVALILILSSITTSAQQTRAVPPNDNFIDAETIQIGKSYSVPDIGAATNQTGEPEASCRFGGDAIPHSVWFKFTLPELSFISLSTFGTQLFGSDFQSMDTVLAVYELTTPTVFTQRACIDNDSGSSAAQLVFGASPGITYYVAAGTAEAMAFLPESTLKLTARMISTAITPPNSSFGTPVNGTDWKVKNASDDGVVCADPAFPSASTCEFRFVGTPGVTTKLTHTLASLLFAPRKNAFLSGFIFFRVLDTAALGTTRMRLTVNYGDGTPPSIQTIDLTGRAAMGGYGVGQFVIILKSSKVASIKFNVKFASSTGGLLVDTLIYNYNADPGPRGNGLLPVPAAQ